MVIDADSWQDRHFSACPFGLQLRLLLGLGIISNPKTLIFPMTKEIPEDASEENPLPDLTRKIITRLGLQPHPEGGFFAETFRSTSLLTLPDGRVRASGTAIYYLLCTGTFSALHRVASDETWHFYDGAPLELTTITPEGVMQKVLLGRDLEAGELPQWVVPAGIWQGARPVSTGGADYSLVGCTVAPGFDFADFAMPDGAQLVNLFQQHAEEVRKLTRS
jgi:predicted cupin superfamily sugar epimerase